MELPITINIHEQVRLIKCPKIRHTLKLILRYNSDGDRVCNTKTDIRALLKPN